MEALEGNTANDDFTLIRKALFGAADLLGNEK